MMDWAASAVRRQGESRVVINTPTKAALLADLEARIGAGCGFSVATLNLDHVVKLRQLPDFRQAYGAHSHVVADGRPIVWLSRLAGQRVDLAAGSDLVEPLAELAARQGIPIALFGSTDASLEKAADALTRRHADLRIAACIAPPMGFDPADETATALIDRLEASGARLCFLALGAPKQEIFAARAQRLLPRMGFASVGAGLDFISGEQIRAPGVFRAVAAEWLWRLGSDPRRLGSRYARCIAVLPGLAWHAYRARQSTSIQSARI
jgi:N-acetylglucosaminyldiphosphoundecaprenol N-acetyl-beta-D-mannosaminyltransferase